MATKKNVNTDPIVFTDPDGETITIEFNRETVLLADKAGLSGENMQEKLQNSPLTTVSALFYFGMLMHQPDTTEDEAIQFFFDNVGADQEIFQRLINLYQKEGSFNAGYFLRYHILSKFYRSIYFYISFS